MNRYRAGAFAAPEGELARLAAQAALIAAEEHAALFSMGLPEAGRALDVGCGPGFFASGLRRARPGLSVVGVDADPYVLPEARGRVPVVRGDVAALPFASASFDLVVARLVLRHLVDPAASLAAMANLVRPEGWIAAIDASDASLHLDPLPDGFTAVAEGRARWFAQRRCSGDVGHELPALLIAARLRRVRVRTVAVDTGLLGTGAFAHIVLGPFLQAAAEALPADARIAAAAQAVARWSTDPAASGSITLFVAAGQRGRA
jgi:SAM-dependent methyltransferase